MNAASSGILPRPPGRSLRDQIFFLFFAKDRP